MKLLSAASAFLLLITEVTSLECPPELTQSMTLNREAGSGLTFKYEVFLSSLSDNRSLLCVRLESDAGGYIVFGTSPSGSMQDGEAVIGIPDDAVTDPGTIRKYYLNLDSPPVLMPDEQQTLMDTKLTSENGNTIVTFSKLLREQGERTILANGENIFVWALGGGSDPDSFPYEQEGSFSLDFEITRPPTTSSITPAPTFGGIEVPQGRARTQSPTMTYIRREDLTPAPSQSPIITGSSPSDAATPGTSSSNTGTTNESTLGTSKADTSASESRAMIRMTGHYMVLSTVALWLTY